MPGGVDSTTATLPTRPFSPMSNFTTTKPDALRGTSLPTTGVTRLTIFAGVTSTAATGFGAGAAAGACTAAAAPGLKAEAALLPPTAESLASTVRPLKFLSRWIAPVLGGE